MNTTLAPLAEYEQAVAQEWCNGCRQPRSSWGPICGGMTQGDMTHYHSADWWRQRYERRVRERAEGIFE